MGEKPLSEQEKLEVMRMFDSFSKKVMKNVAINHKKQMQDIKTHENSIGIENYEELTSDFAENLYPTCLTDMYFTKDCLFEVMGEIIFVDDYYIAEGIRKLPKRQREIILLYYYMTSMNDEKIGKKYGISQQAINEERHSDQRGAPHSRS